MSTVYFNQCKLTKPIATGRIEHTAWIPSKFAVTGKRLKIKSEAGVWENGWVVQNVGDNCVAERQLPDSHKEIKSHRDLTGDSLPKRPS